MKAAIVVLAFLVMAGSVQAQTLDVRLKINNVQNDVYIPGIGEVQSGSLGSGATYASDHLYVASYLNNLMYALAGASGISLYAGNDAGTHTMGISQNLQGSRVLLGFTTGDWNNVDSAIDDLEDGSFFQEISPSFSFGIGAYYPVKVLLSYAGINVTGSVRLHSGLRKIVVSNEGFFNNRPVVRIESP